MDYEMSHSVTAKRDGVDGVSYASCTLSSACAHAASSFYKISVKRQLYLYFLHQAGKNDMVMYTSDSDGLS